MLTQEKNNGFLKQASKPFANNNQITKFRWSLGLKVAEKQMKLSHRENGVFSFDLFFVWLVFLLSFYFSRNVRTLFQIETHLN